MGQMNLTRRRALQGVGVIGLAGLAGNAVVADSTVNNVQQGESAALRVAHVSPDAPSVDVRVQPANGTGAGGTGMDAGTGNDTQAGDDAGVGADDAGDDTGVGNGTDTGDVVAEPGNATGGEGAGNATGQGGASGDEPLIQDLGFREVSNYNEVDPGTYQVQVVATEGTGLIEDIFGDGGEEQVVWEDQVEIQAGTPYTAVAFGELARSEMGEQGAGGADDTGDDTGVGADDAGIGNETDAGDDTTGVGGDGAGDDTGVGADDAGDDAGADGGAAGGPEDGGALIEGLAFGEYEYVDLPPGDHTIALQPSQAAGAMDGATDGVGDDAAGAGTDDAGEDTDVGDDAGDDTTDAGDDGAGEDTGVGQDDTGAGDGTTTQDAGTDRGFQVTVLEDDLSATGGMAGADGAGEGTGVGNDTGIGADDAGEDAGVGNDTENDGDEGLFGNDTQDGGAQQGTARVRVFHAVLDVDAVDVVRVDDVGAAAGENATGAGNDTGAGEDVVADGGTNDTGAGADDGADAGEGAGLDPEGGAAGEPEATDLTGQLSVESGVVYSSFATGYADPQATGTDAGANATGDDGGDGGLLGGGNDTDDATGGDDGAGYNVQVGNDTQDGGEVGAGEDAGVGNDTQAGDGTEGEDDIAQEDRTPGFELVTVVDARDGERADGGTGGLF